MGTGLKGSGILTYAPSAVMATKLAIKIALIADLFAITSLRVNIELIVCIYAPPLP
jgi:hypothetical protein